MSIQEKNAFNDFSNEPISRRACIGENTGINSKYRDMAICDGYCKAAELLYQNMGVWEDIIVYPFMYCVRHSHEIILKINLKMLRELKEIKQPTETMTRVGFFSHDLKVLVDRIKELLSLDRRLDEQFGSWFNESVDMLLEEFYEDTQSDAFRYTYNKQDGINLNNHHIIATNIVYDKFCRASKVFRLLNQQLHVLLEEYGLPTHTQNLSRQDLANIADRLPQYNTWGDENFKKILLGIRSEFKISQRELNKAVSIIKNHREFCVKIGRELQYGSLSMETLEKVAEIERIHLLIEREMFQGGSRIVNISQIKYDAQKKNRMIELAVSIPKEEILLLYVFFEISRSFLGGSTYYSEDLDVIYDKMSNCRYGLVLRVDQDLDMINDEMSNWSIDYLYFVGKCSDAYKKLSKSFNKCGQTTYLKMLNKAYGIS